MTKHNAGNERIKHRYFVYLKEAKRRSEATVDAAAKALDRFEVWTNHRDFKAFHFEQAVSFKRHLAEQTAAQSGEKFSIGDSLCHAGPPEEILPVAFVATWIQVTHSVLRC
jgi:hypothetical protein